MSLESYDYTTAYGEHGNGKYLAEGETLEKTIEEDAKILREHNISKKEIGRSLRKLFLTYNDFALSPSQQEPVKGIVIWREYYDLGSETCPYVNGLYSNIDWRVQVDGLNNGNKKYHPKDGPTFVSDMLPEMIEKIGFFEGNVFYGIKPEWVIAVHEMVKDAKLVPYEPKHAERAWSSPSRFLLHKKDYPHGPGWNSLHHNSYGPGSRGNYSLSDELENYIKNRIKKEGAIEKISPTLIAHITPAKIDLIPPKEIQEKIKKKIEWFVEDTKIWPPSVQPSYIASLSDILNDINVISHNREFIGMLEISEKISLVPNEFFSIKGLPLSHCLYGILSWQEAGSTICICLDGRSKRVG